MVAMASCDPARGRFAVARSRRVNALASSLCRGRAVWFDPRHDPCERVVAGGGDLGDQVGDQLVGVGAGEHAVHVQPEESMAAVDDDLVHARSSSAGHDSGKSLIK
ncbi:hypothetical protein WR25_23844 [Diploscapter pachys]|uniref:Uncharacterized protein n=1 Tax=Diploscapter pachys TaxID=2018661 RepID=A0A2A2M1Z5_9BILA|nr:hypothetical protein WR25_23844 [Diploscapter pachys]